MALIIVFALLSAAFTGLTYYFTGLWQNLVWIWTIPLMLYAYFLMCFAGWIIFLYVGGLFVKADEDYTYKPNRFAQWVVRHTARVILLLLHCVVHRNGFGKIPPHAPVVLMHNHLSSFDEFALAAFFPRHIIFISKPGNFRIPVAGAWMRYAGYIATKQGGIADGQRVITMATEYVTDKKCTVCVAPEGTRNKDFPETMLLPFHAGTFRLAQDSKAPLVLVAIQNTNAITHRFPRHLTHIYLDVVGVITGEEMEGLSSRELADKSRAMILKRLEQKDARVYHVRSHKEKAE